MAKCTKCGENAGFLMALCDSCIKKSASSDLSKQQKLDDVQRNFELNVSKIILTTAPSLEGYKVIETLEIITAECVYGMNMLRDIFASFTDIFGGRSESSQRVLRDARKTCLNELKKEASILGADAVIAVDLDYSEFSGDGKSMLFLVASGTAVKIEKYL